MKEIILFYTHGGSTRRYAEKYAAGTGAKVVEVKELKSRSGLGTWCPGVFQAMGGKRTAIEPIDVDLASYDKIVLAAPIWAGNPAPAINSAADLLPAGKQVVVVLVSSSGGGSAAKLTEYVRARNSEVLEVKMIKASDI